MSSTLQRPDQVRPPAAEAQRVVAEAGQRGLHGPLSAAENGTHGRPKQGRFRRVGLLPRLVWPLLLLGCAAWTAGIASLAVGRFQLGGILVAGAFLLTLLGLACAAASTRGAHLPTAAAPHGAAASGP